jgi:protein-tyrosine-phosphatase
MPRLLFVCVENANRSQMAEGFARFHGGHRVEALSAGSRPLGHVNPRAIEAMAELGIDIGSQLCRSVDDITGEFDAVVTMGCGDACPHIPARVREDWPVKDTAGRSDEAYRAIRDDIRKRVQSLLANLRSQR